MTCKCNLAFSASIILLILKKKIINKNINNKSKNRMFPNLKFTNIFLQNFKYLFVFYCGTQKLLLNPMN